MSLISPKLWVVATPLGNPGDLSARGREILSSADLILAEDTRRAGLLLQRLGVERAKGSRFLSLFEHNEQGRIPQALDALRAGESVALISDAGAPLLADPGYLLVRACRQAGFEVSPVPGPCAVTTALMACGLPPYPYAFLGFPPRKPGDVRKFFERFAGLDLTLVFYERKDRVRKTLEQAYAALGSREFCLARELTKVHEEFIFGRLELWAETSEELKGELTVVVGPPESKGMTDETVIEALLREESARGGAPKDIARRVKDRATGWSVKDIYERIQSERERGPDESGD